MVKLPLKPQRPAKKSVARVAHHVLTSPKVHVRPEPVPQDVRPYTDLGGSLAYAGYHHFCLTVANVDATVEELRARGVNIVAEPFVVEAISRRLAFFADPFGNLVELAELLA